MKRYRDLTGDDVLQEGDVQPSSTIRFGWEPVSTIGMKACEVYPYTFRRPLTPAEITAANRVKFEAWCYSRGNKNNIRLAHGEYADLGVCLEWQAWCAAVNCDPMGDV